jgi:acyl carrier protein
MDLTRVHDVIAAALKRELGGIDLTDDLDLVESGIIDSLALTTIVAALESAYPGLRIPDSDATVENLASVDRIEAYLAGRG